MKQLENHNFLDKLKEVMPEHPFLVIYHEKEGNQIFLISDTDKGSDLGKNIISHLTQFNRDVIEVPKEDGGSE